MVSKKLIARIFIYFFVVLFVSIAWFLYFFGDINKLKSSIEKNLKEQLTCIVKLGELEWDWKGLEIGVTTSGISLFDNDNNLVLQSGPTRFVWHLKNIITGTYSHFYKIDATELYLNAIHYKDDTWNIIKIFPPGPIPKVDNLKLHNSIIYLVEEFNPISNRTILYKDLNINLENKLFLNLTSIDLVTRVGSLTSPSFIKVQGKYIDTKRFDWKKSAFDISVTAEKVNLANWQGYLAYQIKEPELKEISGEFTGEVNLQKQRNRGININSSSNTKNLTALLNNKGILQLIEIPKTDLKLSAIIDKNKINVKTFKSNIDELSYELSGSIVNWSKNLPEVDLTLKTNRFNFKTVKPYLPISLLPPDTRARIEPINDDGFVQLDVNIQGPLITPKYYGTISLDNFNLTEESGFVTTIQGLEGKLILDGQILNIDHLNIPVENSVLVLKGRIDNENFKILFNLKGKDLNLYILQDLLFQAGLNPQLASTIQSKGKLDLNLDVIARVNSSPEIKGAISFHDAGISVIANEPLEIKNAFGELFLDGSKITFKRLSGLINNEDFYIDGDLSLKEDEKVNLLIKADHLKIIHYILSFLSAKTPFRPVAETISGEARNLNLKIGGTLSKPLLDGMVLINNVSFSLPNLSNTIDNISGSLIFEGTELIIEELSGKVKDSDFAIVGYIENLLTAPKPKFRLVTNDVEVKPFWDFIKEQLKTTSLSIQAEELEKLEGIAALDIFLHNDAVVGNVYFKDGEIKYKSLPFGLNSLSGRLVIGEKNLSLFGLMGLVDNSNNFNCDLTVFNYSAPSFYIQGKLALDLDPSPLLKSINPNIPSDISNNIHVGGLIPTLVDFNISFPDVRLYIFSTLDDMTNLEIEPYFKKPPKRSYTISGNIDLDTKNNDIYLSQFNITGKKLSLTTNGKIKNITSKNPEFMLYFNTEEPSGLYRITEFFTPLIPYMVWGEVNLNSSVSGTLSMFSISTNATLKKINAQSILGKKLASEEGVFNFYYDNEQGAIYANLNNIEYVSFMAKSASLSANYINPVIYLNELKLNEESGNIFAFGSYNPTNNDLSINANGENLNLSNLGEFIFLDPSKISGKTNFSFVIDGKGKTKEEFISSTNGNLSFSVVDGKLGQVALLQKGLKVANLFGQGLLGFNVSNIFSLFFKYQDEGFNTIDGKLNIKNGRVNAKDFHYRAKNLLLNSLGFIDLNSSLIGLSFYGYLPEKAEALNRRIVIPFLHTTPPRYFRFQVKGDLKNQKNLMRRTARSFRWLRGRRLQKEYKFVPK